MVDFIIDSNIDLPKKYIEENNIKVVPVYILKNNEQYPLTLDFKYKFYKNKEFRKLWLEGKLKTSQPSLEDFLRAYKECESEIIVFVTSSKLAGNYNVAVNAAKIVDKKIYVVDTLNISIGAGLLVILSKKLSKKYDYKELIDKIEKLKKRIKAFAFVEDINYLLRSGRIDIVKYSFLKLVNKKPILTIKDGKIELFKLSSNLYQDFENLEKQFKIKIFGTNSIRLNRKEILIAPSVSIHAGPGFGFAALK